MSDCIFCKIINKEVPAKIIKENDNVLVIQDINPKAPIHYLVIPKQHIENMQSLEDSNKDIMWSALKMIKFLSQELNLSAFNILSNNGKDAGQSVMHLHLHFVAGKSIVKDTF